jgi:phosphatidate cytidylyltransferase
MNEATWQRLFGWQHAFDHPAVPWLVGGVLLVLVLATLLVAGLAATGRIGAATRTELRQRIGSWWLLAPLMIGPVLLGAAWTFAAVLLLSLGCYREFARATGLFREHLTSALVVLGILAATFAIVDHWYDLFLAVLPLGVVTIAGLAVLADAPRGYVQRTALGVFAFAFFGFGFGHLAYFGNDVEFRPIILFVLIAVELNDVFAYVTGRLFGSRKLLPHTSPNKTWGGAIGAVVLTTAFVWLVGPHVLAGRPSAGGSRLLLLGVLIAVAGQLGDLVLSSIKRDVGIKDFAATIPGHGGLLDRFDSLVLVAPAVFHLIGYQHGIGLSSVPRLLTGG